MQGSVWGGLKCTSQNDKLNKIMKASDSLCYKYRNDPNIKIGVLGFVDDTLGISECGDAAIVKNATINSFVETHRQTMHDTKSVVIHVGNVKKCSQPCPTLKVHDTNMHEAKSTKYLGNIITSSGGVRETIEDRRNQGWGRVAQIMSILGEVALGTYRIEVGLMLRKAILTSGLLYSAEAWSAVSENEIKRLEQVDASLIKGLVNGHSKTPSVFHYLETGSLMLRHILRINRLMYHYHIVNLADEDTVKKIYEKQKTECLKGDWVQLIKEDFAFIGLDMNEDEIKNSPSEIYRKKIKGLVRKAAFRELLEKKNQLSKIRDLKYETFEIQPYLKSKDFNSSERNLLYSLRSRMHPAKTNFRKMHSNNLECSQGCPIQEDQCHIFSGCDKLNSDKNTNIYEHIFEDIDKQKEVICAFLHIEERRKELNLLFNDPC